MSNQNYRNARPTKGAGKRSTQELELLVRQRTQAVRTLSAKLLRVQDEERRRLARELHDSTGQILTALKLHVVNLQNRLSGGRPDPEGVEEVKSLADQALQDIRTISYLLFPPLLDEMGFGPAAKWYAEGFSTRSHIHVRLCLAPITRLPGSIETALFRVLQESLTNVYRHSGSKVVDVRAALEADCVILEVQDYGKGLPAPLLDQFHRTGSASGVGLAGMRERMQDFGGQLEIVSGSSGTLIRAAVPLSDVVKGLVEVGDCANAIAA